MPNPSWLISPARLAAPLRDRRGIAVATLCFIVPIDSSSERKRELLDRLVEAARELSDQ